MRSLLITSEAVARAALMREESRGAHTRLDFEGERDEWVKYNVVDQEGRGGRDGGREGRAPARAGRTSSAIANAKIEDLEAGKVGAEREVHSWLSGGRSSVWRGDAEGGEFKALRGRGRPGHGRARRAAPDPGAARRNDLALRWNCKAGKCGSCSMEINGKPRLACMTRMNIFAADETITVQPLKTFPVIKDLVTDVSLELRAEQAHPRRSSRSPRGPDGKHRMYQEDVDRVQEFRKCIECFLCQDVCHVLRDRDAQGRSSSARAS